MNTITGIDLDLQCSDRNAVSTYLTLTNMIGFSSFSYILFALLYHWPAFIILPKELTLTDHVVWRSRNKGIMFPSRALYYTVPMLKDSTVESSTYVVNLIICVINLYHNFDSNPDNWPDIDREHLCYTVVYPFFKLCLYNWSQLERKCHINK